MKIDGLIDQPMDYLETMWRPHVAGLAWDINMKKKVGLKSLEKVSMANIVLLNRFQKPKTGFGDLVG